MRNNSTKKATSIRSLIRNGCNSTSKWWVYKQWDIINLHTKARTIVQYCDWMIDQRYEDEAWDPSKMLEEHIWRKPDPKNIPPLIKKASDVPPAPEIRKKFWDKTDKRWLKDLCEPVRKQARPQQSLQVDAELQRPTQRAGSAVFNQLLFKAKLFSQWKPLSILLAVSSIELWGARRIIDPCGSDPGNPAVKEEPLFAFSCMRLVRLRGL